MPLGDLSCLTALRILAPGRHEFAEDMIDEMLDDEMMEDTRSEASSYNDDNEDLEEEEEEMKGTENRSKVSMILEQMDIDSGGSVVAGCSSRNPTIGPSCDDEPSLQSAERVRTPREPELHLHFLAAVSALLLLKKDAAYCQSASIAISKTKSEPTQQFLPQLPNLRFLVLTGVRSSGICFRHISGLPNLQVRRYITMNG